MNVRSALVVTFMGHALNHSLTMLYPVVMIELARLYPEASLATLGLVGTVHYVLYGLGALPAGWLTDRLGARNVLLIYLAGAAAAAFLLTLATSLAALAAGLALLGLFCSLYHPAGLTLISHTSSRLSRHLGVHGIAGSLGLTLGPLLGAVLVNRYGWEAPYRLLGLLAAAGALAVLLFTPNTPGAIPADHPQAGRRTQWRPLIYSYTIGAFMGLAYRGTLSFMPLHFANQFAGGVDPVLVGGLLTALVLASGIAGQILGGRLGDRYSRPRLLVLVVAANIPFLLAIAFLRGPLQVLAAVLWGVTNFSYQPIANALVADFSSARRRGSLFGILNGVSFGVGALAATLAGAVADRWDTAAIFLIMALLLLPAVAAGALLFRSGGSRLAPASP